MSRARCPGEVAPGPRRKGEPWTCILLAVLVGFFLLTVALVRLLEKV